MFLSAQLVSRSRLYIVHTSMNTMEPMLPPPLPEPTYIPMTPAVDTAKSRQIPREGYGTLQLGLSLHEKSARRRKRTESEQQNRNKVVKQGGPCLRCKWKKSQVRQPSSWSQVLSPRGKIPVLARASVSTVCEGNQENRTKHVVLDKVYSGRCHELQCFCPR